MHNFEGYKKKLSRGYIRCQMSGRGKGAHPLPELSSPKHGEISFRSLGGPLVELTHSPCQSVRVECRPRKQKEEKKSLLTSRKKEFHP